MGTSSCLSLQLQKINHIVMATIYDWCNTPFSSTRWSTLQYVVSSNPLVGYYEQAMIRAISGRRSLAVGLS
jgi:hypothetical protein